jgi:predicted phage tail protein
LVSGPLLVADGMPFATPLDVSSTDLDGKRVVSGGAQPTAEPRSQDTARGGRGLGLGITTVLGAVLVAVPVIWAVAYLMQAGAAGLSGGFVFAVGIVLLGVLGVGMVLLRGLFRT